MTSSIVVVVVGEGELVILRLEISQMLATEWTSLVLTKDQEVVENWVIG